MLTTSWRWDVERTNNRYTNLALLEKFKRGSEWASTRWVVGGAGDRRADHIQVMEKLINLTNIL
ncbi:MAG: hypothetical protein GY847_19025 [Proteobacteria bacterium]|nr:hypothetical protein [Pseudomonadota bacterium]